MQYQFESNYKKFGYLEFNSDQLDIGNNEKLVSFIKVLIIPPGYRLIVDFNIYETTSFSLFFINTNQYLNFATGSGEYAKLLHYNRDFYCIQIHDDEIACDGLLFNNLLQKPKVDLNEKEALFMDSIFQNIKLELKNNDHASEEMIRTYLKQIIILATRLWKKQNLDKQLLDQIAMDIQLFRDFGRLVEIHFREKHSVAEYADLMHFAPKTLANKFNKLHLENPNEIIKNRIILEAKRLLSFTDLTVKEIAYQLGYDEPAYFNRLFTQKTGTPPASFRKKTNRNCPPTITP